MDYSGVFWDYVFDTFGVGGGALIAWDDVEVIYRVLGYLD